MMISANNRDIFWAYLSQFLNVGISIILLPVILRMFSPSDIGLWFAFITLASVAQLVEFGFQPTIVRNISYVYSGASNLMKEGLASIPYVKSEVNFELLLSLYLNSKKIYKKIFYVSLFVLVVIGSIYIYSLLQPGQDTFGTLIAWVLFSLGYVFNLYYGYLNCFLVGRGDITQANKSIVFGRTVFIFIGVGLTLLGQGLLGVALASLISSIVSRAFSFRYFKAHKLAAQLLMNQKPLKDFNILSILWHSSWRMGVVQCGAFLILKMNILIASSVLGVDKAASYSMGVTLLTFLLSLSSVIIQAQLPHITSLQINKNLKTIVPIVGEALIISNSMFLMGLLFLIFLGDNILLIIGSKVTMLPINLLIFFGVIVLLELNHSLFSYYLITLNKIPFVPSSIISGLAVVILSLVLAKPFGIYGLILSQGFVQLLYNNWKWPQLALANMNCNLWQIFLSGKIRISERLS